MSTYKVGFIGAGQMGGALLRGLISAALVRPENILVGDANIDRLEELRRDFGVIPAPSNREVVRDSDVIVIAVKPQHLGEIVMGFAELVRDDQIVISIAAGMTTEKVSAALGGRGRLVRVMPNSPALVGKGMSVVSPAEGVDREAVEVAIELFGAVGEVVELPEDFQNRVTAISGSGPAYFYYLVEVLIEAAVKMGVADDVASKLVIQTIAGSAVMLTETGRTPAELREMVTSPGGTTEAALGVFKKSNFSGIVEKALSAAVERATELAG